MALFAGSRLSLRPTCSPTDAVIFSPLAPMIGYAHKIHQHLATAQTLRHSPEVRIIGPDHHRLREVEDRIDAIHHEPGNMWDVVEDKVPVGTDQFGDVHVLVK